MARQFCGEAAPWRNPIKKVKTPKVPELILDPADPDDVRKVIDSLGDDVRDLRDKAILRTLYDTGLRAKELLSLDLADFDYASGALLVRDGKSGKPRFVFVGRKTRLAIRAYLKKRGDTPGPLFLTRSKVRRRMTYSCLRLMVEKRSKAAGVEPMPIHSFRWAFALEMVSAKVDFITLQRLMGHAPSSLQLLRRYAKQSVEDLRLAHEAASPGDKL